MEFGWETVPNWECLSVHRKHKLFLSVHVHDINMAGMLQNLALIWKKLMKDVDIEEPTSFLDHVYLGCTQREFKPNEKIIRQHNKMFESRISAGATEKLQGWDKPRAKTSAWSNDVGGHARKCMERYDELAHKKSQQLHNVAPMLYQNACTWHELVDLTFCGQSTNWHDLSQNGLKHVTDD